jgi:hypothetical protein
VGKSTYSRLYFGFKVGDEDDPPEFLERLGAEDIDDVILKDAGLSDSEDWKVRNAAIEACPADLVRTGTWDCCGYFLIVRGAKHSAEWGDVVMVDEAALAVAPERVEAFKSWCLAHGVEYEEPRWLLTSFYG